MTEKGNSNAQKHGGEAGVKALTAGTPLTGLAASVEGEVKAELQDAGAAGVILKGATRLETVSRLYFDAFVASIQAGDLAKADGYAARYGWLQNSSIRAMAEVVRSSKGKGGRLPEVLAAYSVDIDGSPQEGQGGEQ
jgi:hypothetical protein